MAELTEVLRCKDCLFRMRTDWNSRAYYCSYHARNEIVTAYDYCSKGIREEANDDRTKAVSVLRRRSNTKMG